MVPAIAANLGSENPFCLTAACLQGRITDHRVGLTEHGMEEMLVGAKLPAFIEALRRQEQVELLASLHEADG